MRLFRPREEKPIRRRRGFEALMANEFAYPRHTPPGTRAVEVKLALTLMGAVASRVDWDFPAA